MYDKMLFLNNETAKRLYEFARTLPVIDYHNHLSTQDIVTDKRFDSIYDLWIKPDPYKHRAMRMCGVEEKYITGASACREKFRKWCETVPRLIGNPLQVWAAAELYAVFGIEELPNGENADKIYEQCNEYLKTHAVSPSMILRGFNVEFVCPCMSLCDDTEAFKGMKTAAPSLRCDDLLLPSAETIKKLEEKTNGKINGMADFKAAVTARLTEFLLSGCVFADIALDNGFVFCEDDQRNDDRFMKLLHGEDLEKEDAERLFSYILEFLGESFARLGLVMQLHIGAQRSTSSRLRKAAGPAGGFAGIGNSADVKSLTSFLDTLDNKEVRLPKTILFTLNPVDNALFSVLSGSFAKDGAAGLITQGPAWWWCDHGYGIEEMLENTAAFGVLSNFVGMTTDSRSFLSFVRHDYFRRILCGFLGEKLEKHMLACRYEDLEDLVYNMCYKNAKNLIGGRENEI